MSKFPAKRQKITKTRQPEKSGLRTDHDLHLTGTLWDSKNWSCAYDAICVPLFHTLRTRSHHFVTEASELSPSMKHLANSTLSIIAQSSNFQHHLNQLRDSMRDILSDADSHRFPRFGPCAIGVFEPLCAVFGSTSLEARGQLICTSCYQPRIADSGALRHNAIVTNLHMALHLHGNHSPIPTTTRPTTSFNNWLCAYWLNCFSFSARLLDQFSETQPCPSCSQQSPLALVLRITHAPIFFFIETSGWDFETNPFHSLSLVMVDGTPISYHLCAAIYHGVNHWTSRWISPNGHVWNHDGQKHRGALQSDGKMIEPFGRSKHCSLHVSGSGTLSILIYALDT